MGQTGTRDPDDLTVSDPSIFPLCFAAFMPVGPPKPSIEAKKTPFRELTSFADVTAETSVFVKVRSGADLRTALPYSLDPHTQRGNDKQSDLVLSDGLRGHVQHIR